MDRYDWWPHMMNNGVDLREFQKFNWYSHVINPKILSVKYELSKLGYGTIENYPNDHNDLISQQLHWIMSQRGGSKSQVMQLKK